jgi:hypothetical protein
VNDTPIPVGTRIDGPYGTVHPVPHPEPNEPGLADASRAALRVCLSTYLIDAPAYHPAWTQYVMSVVTLRDEPGVEPAVRKFPEATHEILVLALNPETGPQTVETMIGHCRTGRLPFLRPVNIAEQIEATDDEAEAVAWLAARAVVHGHLSPEPPFGYESLRAQWHAACTKTLAHLRGEPHTP